MSTTPCPPRGMSGTFRFALTGFLFATTLCAQEIDLDRYAWQFPSVIGLPAADSDPLVEELRAELERVLDAGRLAPLYISYADQESVGYKVYQEPGRIVGTLAWAYPHLTVSQQERVRAYVNDEFASPAHAPWGITIYGKNGNSNYPLPGNAGTPREEHPKERWWFHRDDFGNNRPFLHTLYGVWLYGHRTGDFLAVSNAWPTIKRAYANYGTGEAYRLYGTMGLHIAMARLAHQLGDSAQQADALANLSSRLAAGLDFTAVESVARGTEGNEWRSPYGSYPDMYDSRMDSSTYRGWMFLNLPPEIGRFLAEVSPDLRAQVLERHAAGIARFPLWWIPKANYFNRSWTGDEGSGLVPEIVGMIAPIERWVVGATPDQLGRWTRSAPNGRGDCYWIEALVQAIEARGTLRWIDVRRASPRLDQARWLPGSAFRLTLTGSAAQDYTLQQSADLVTWNDLLTGPSPLHYTNSAPTGAVLFFRAI